MLCIRFPAGVLAIIFATTFSQPLLARNSNDSNVRSVGIATAIRISPDPTRPVGHTYEMAQHSPSIEGTYRVMGQNPNGTSYGGTVSITALSNDRYRFDWQVGDAYTGTGTLVNNRILVDWGSEAPAIYIVNPDGTLSGTWAGGQASEYLRPVVRGAEGTQKPDTPPSDTVPIRVPGFPVAGYSAPDLLDAIYQGQTEQIDPDSVGFYLIAFIGMFTRSDMAECRGVVSTATATRIAAAGGMDILGQIFGGLVEAHRDGGSRDDLFGQGFGAGAATFGGMALSEAGAEADAQIFYDRHGCATEVAGRFFDQLTEFAWQN